MVFRPIANPNFLLFLRPTRSPPARCCYSLNKLYRLCPKSYHISFHRGYMAAITHRQIIIMTTPITCLCTLALFASCSFNSANCAAAWFMSSFCSILLPSNSLTEIPNKSAIHISISASGTDNPFSHLETVWRTTFNSCASTSWDIPFCLRSIFKFSLNTTNTPPVLKTVLIITVDFQLPQAMQINIIHKLHPIPIYRVNFWADCSI